MEILHRKTAGVCLLSKLSQLKQDAYQAGKKKDWDQAVSIYEKILELEKTNPTTINEMGDLCLKAGEPGRAISHFLKAASKYRTTGLLNNAVAIYKKILRHDETNLNAHWYLAETRASQGLTHEGETHALQFLDNSEEVSGDLKEIFLKRCRELFELYAESKDILDKLLMVFRTWDMGLEAARTQCLLACRQYDEGNQDQAKEAMSQVLERTPEMANYPEFNRWNDRVNPVNTKTNSFSDFGSVSFDQPAVPAAPGTEKPDTAQVTSGPQDSLQDRDPFGFGGLADTTAADSPVEDVIEIPDSPQAPAAAAETSFGDLQAEVDKLNGQEDADQPDEEGCFSLDADEDSGLSLDTDDEGCFSLDDQGGGGSFDDLIAQCTSSMEDSESQTASDPEAEVSLDTDPGDAPATGTPAATTGLDVDEEKVDLLAEILAEDSLGESASEENQLDTISKEIGAQIGGNQDTEDASQLYEMGLVYLEMGLFDQACESLEKATGDDQFALRAYEMWGVALSRSGQPDQAVEVLGAGLPRADEGSAEFLGLLYHMGQAHQQAGRGDKASECYLKIQEQDRNFLDVGKRLAELDCQV